MRGATLLHERTSCSAKFLLTRPMRGATTDKMKHPLNELFLLTRPMRGATDSVSWVSHCKERFLLTRPMRGATAVQAVAEQHDLDFYSHAPCGARQRPMVSGDLPWVISTHTPHAGRDYMNEYQILCAKISTHTPHAGRDLHKRTITIRCKDFYSHAPCGARRMDQ